MSDPTFAQQLQAYERWKQDAGNTSAERYEDWLELTRKEDLWVRFVDIWSDESMTQTERLLAVGDLVREWRN